MQDNVAYNAMTVAQRHYRQQQQPPKEKAKEEAGPLHPVDESLLTPMPDGRAYQRQQQFKAGIGEPLTEQEQADVSAYQSARSLRQRQRKALERGKPLPRINSRRSSVTQRTVDAPPTPGSVATTALTTTPKTVREDVK